MTGFQSITMSADNNKKDEVSKSIKKKLSGKEIVSFYEVAMEKKGISPKAFKRVLTFLGREMPGHYNTYAKRLHNLNTDLLEWQRPDLTNEQINELDPDVVIDGFRRQTFDEILARWSHLLAEGQCGGHDGTVASQVRALLRAGNFLKARRAGAKGGSVKPSNGEANDLERTGKKLDAASKRVDKKTLNIPLDQP